MSQTRDPTKITFSVKMSKSLIAKNGKRVIISFLQTLIFCEIPLLETLTSSFSSENLKYYKVILKGTN